MKTAIEWFVEQMSTDLKMQLGYELIEQAKEMDKQQKKKDFEKGYECGVGDYIDCENGFDYKSIGFEEYYNKEYGYETTEKLE